MRWFLGQTEPDAGSEPYLWRRTDLAMAERVTNLGIPRDTVQQVGRCSNVWRAVELANLLGLAREAVCAGKGKLIETHPRVAWAVVIASLSDRDTAESLVTHYKGARQEDRGKRHQQKEHRERMLRLLCRRRRPPSPHRRPARPRLQDRRQPRRPDLRLRRLPRRPRRRRALPARPRRRGDRPPRRRGDHPDPGLAGAPAGEEGRPHKTPAAAQDRLDLESAEAVSSPLSRL